MPYFLVPAEKGVRIPIDKAIVFIGRHPDCDVVLTRSRKVSRKHCAVAQVNDKIVIRDLGSMNGIRVNGTLIRKEMQLRVGDQVTIGDVSYTVKSTSDAKSAMRKPKHAAKKAQAELPDVSPETAAKPRDAGFFSQEIPVPVADVDDDLDPIADVDDDLEDSLGHETPESIPTVDERHNGEHDSGSGINDERRRFTDSGSQVEIISD